MKQNCINLIIIFRDSKWWILLLLLTVFSFGTRLHKVDEPDHVWYVLLLFSNITIIYCLNYLVGMKHILEKWEVGT